MNSIGNNPKHPPDFLRQSFLGLALVCLTIMPPFALNNLMHGRYLLGTGAFMIVAIFAFNTWQIIYRDRYYAILTLLGLVPAILFFLALSLRTQGMIGVFWCYPAAVSFYFMLPERRAWLANVVLLLIVLPMAWRVMAYSLAVRMVATLIMVSVFSAIFVRVITMQQKKLHLQAITDVLTGLFNRTLLHETLDQAVEQSRRQKIAMTLIALDIDHFKAINDTFGHDVGDQVLRRLGNLLKQRIRRTDRAFRLGGEEFLVLLFGANPEEAQQVAEELRHLIAQLPLLPDRSVTVSIGIATLQLGESWSQWMKRSDKNLYCAKANGRNRVVA
ncbi:MAG: diguanylate cyclase [Leptolyngbya sp. SIO4C5]|nr:diguanylate cyclase [Leptolyngbya sp. SIO4C5]